MKNTVEFLNDIIKERPVGSKNNENILTVFQKEILQMGYNIISLPFRCKRWEKGRSFIEAGNLQFKIFPSPFSKAYEGHGEISIVHSLNELEIKNISDKIVFLQGEIARCSLMPKNFPFHYPDEHKRIIDLLEEKKPKAIIAVTGKHPMSGLNPFPLFEDGNFLIPSAYTTELIAEKIKQNDYIGICIDSKNENENSRQLLASKKSTNKAKGKIIVCAHIDTKYGTLGALDNAVGVAVMLEVMENLKSYDSFYDIDFVPFNGEEYYESSGELKYMDYVKNELETIKLVINIDAPCHIDSKIAISAYNFGEELSKMLNTEITKSKNIVLGTEWYAGDHSMFAFKGIPCIAVTSSNLFESVIEITHTERDTKDQINYDLVGQTAKFLIGFIKSIEAV